MQKLFSSQRETNSKESEKKNKKAKKTKTNHEYGIFKI